MAKIWNNPITDNTDWGGDSSTNNLPVSGEQVQAWIKQKLSYIKTDDQLEEFLTGLLEEKGIAADGGFVTLKTEQEIEGAKNFIGGLKVSGAPIQYDAEKDAWVFVGNVVITRGLAVCTTIDDFHKVSVFEDIPIDGTSIKWVNGKLVATGSGSGSSGEGIDEEQLEEYLTSNAYATQNWVAAQNYATQTWVEEKNYLTEELLGERFVTLDTEQTINAVKDFAAGIKVGGRPITYNAELDAWVLNGNLLVTGGAAFHSSLTAFDVHGVMDAIKYDKKTLRINENGELEVIGATSGGDGEGGISEITAEMIIEALGYTPYNPDDFTKSNIQTTLGISNWALATSKPSYAYSEISGTPSSLKNPYAITFSGYDTGTYDGSKALSIEIPEELPNPYSLSWSGYSSGSYDGSSSKSISIPYRLSHLTDDILSGYYLPIDGIADRAKILSNSLTDTSYLLFNSNELNHCNNGNTNRFWFGYRTPSGSSRSTNQWLFSSSAKTALADGEIWAGKIYIGDKLGNFNSGSFNAPLHVNGNAYVSGQFAHANTSDMRLKQNVRKFKVREYLSTLGGAFLFEYIDEEVERDAFYTGTHVGLIYQNVKKSQLKGMCIEREDGFGALNYFHSDYLGLLGAAAIEHEDRIYTLEHQIEAMQKELKELKSA